MNKNSLPYTIIFIFLLSFVFVSLLAMARESTADIVKTNEEIASKSSILKAFHIAFKKGDVDDINAQFQAHQVTTKYFHREGDSYQPIDDATAQKLKAAKSGDLVTLYSAVIGNESYWAKSFVGYGLWGAVPGVMAFSHDLSRMYGFEPYPGQHSETPGLGARIEEDWFKDQFKGEKIINGGVIVHKVGEGANPDPANKDDGVVDGITGATLTSKGMEKAVFDEVATMKKIVGVQ